MSKFGNFMNTTSGGALTGGLMDGIGSLFTIGAQKRAATTAYNRQKEFWNMQNAYNTPKAQMDRLKAAGLNPALMYGQGNTGNAQNLSGVQKANVQGPQLAQSAAAGAQMSLLNQQRQLMKEQGKAALVNATANFRNSLTNRKKYQLDKSVTPYTIQSLQTGVDKMNQEIQESAQRILESQAKESFVKQQKANELIREEILKIDRNWLRDNKTSTFETTILRTLKSLLGDTNKVLKEVNKHNGDPVEALKTYTQNPGLIQGLIQGLKKAKNKK